MLGQNFLAEFSFLIVEKYLSNEKIMFTEIHLTLRASAWDLQESFLLLVHFNFHFEKATCIKSNVNTQVATGNVIVKVENYKCVALTRKNLLKYTCQACCLIAPFDLYLICESI